MHSDLTRAPIRVDLVGVDARARERFETVFRDLGQGAYMVVNSTVAEVAIVDLDNPDGSVFWHRYCHQFPNRPVILLSDSKPPLERWERFLPKPIHVDALLDVLEQTRRRLALLDANVNPSGKRKLADNVEPGTIKITEQSAFVPPGCAIWRDERFMDTGHPSGEAGPNGESNPSHWRGLDALVDSRLEGPANASSLSPEHTPQAPEQPPAPSQALGDEFPEVEGTSERTHRYPQSQGPGLHGDDRSPQEPPYPEPNSPPFAENPGEPVDGLTLYERTSRIRVGFGATPQATFLSAHDRLLGLVQAALKESTPSQPAVEVALEQGYLLVHVSQGCVYCSLTDEQLKQLAKRIFPSVPELVRPCGINSPDSTLTARRPQSGAETLEAFLWKLALWTYGGCLPLGTQLERRVYLRHWPNLTRLHLVPDAMRIAALWNEQPMTLGYTAKALGIPQQHVFNFYCASHTIGLAGQARREADYLFHETSTHPKGKLGFVSDMMKRLRSIGNT